MARVFITGTSSGFGYLTTNTLIERGHTVFATMREPFGRNEDKKKELEANAEGTKGSLHILSCDVTDESSVNKAVRKAMELENGIDVVVNNAGVGSAGLTEAYTPEAIQSLFEINVFGVQRVNRAALIHMRDQGSGLLIHVSSGLGRVVLPYCGPYVASKWALEGLAESYRYELAPVGVDSVIVEPGGFATGFFDGMREADDEGRLATYGLERNAPGEFWKAVGGSFSSEDAASPQLVADAIGNLIEMAPGTRPLRTVVDPNFGAGPVAINEVASHVQKNMFEHMGLAPRINGPTKS